MIDTNIKLTLRRCDSMDDWWVIERAEHDGREWYEPTEYGQSFRGSLRFSDADVEGNGAQMLEIADAIEQKASKRFKRCAVRCEGNLAFFSSPRNSQNEGVTNYEHALDLAKQIRAAIEGSKG